MIRFFWNGIKVDGGKLILVYYSHDNGIRYHAPQEPERISVSALGYGCFPDAVRKVYEVINHTDLRSDYHDHDRFRVHPGEIDWPAVAAAYARTRERKILRLQRRAAKRPTDYNRGEVASAEHELAEFRVQHLPAPHCPLNSPAESEPPELQPPIPYPEWLP